MIKGKKYRYKHNGTFIYDVIFVYEKGALVEYDYQSRRVIGTIEPDKFSSYEEYTPPVKPFRIRTVAVVNTVTGSVRVASITDNYPMHRVDDPSWPTGWGTNNEVRVYDQIVSVNSEEK